MTPGNGGNDSLRLPILRKRARGGRWCYFPENLGASVSSQAKETENEEGGKCDSCCICSISQPIFHDEEGRDYRCKPKRTKANEHPFQDIFPVFFRFFSKKLDEDKGNEEGDHRPES